MKVRWLFVILGLVSVIGLGASCGDDDDDGDDGGATATAAGGGSEVDVTLVEFAVVPDPSTVDAGPVTFHITNDGPEDQHEFVVIKTDLDPAELPTGANGAVDEEGAGIEPIDEVEEIDVGVSEDLTVDLEPGKYALICNIYDEDEQESHYQEGMHVAFTVQ